MPVIAQTSSVALINWPPALVNNLDKHERDSWETASWQNKDPRFNTVWQYDNISFNNGIMTLAVDNEGCPEHCEGKPYASGEYRSAQESFLYGYFEARLKAARGDGLVTSFFINNGAGDEIVFEFLGRAPRQVQTNYFNLGEGLHEQMIPLKFDASRDFHNYGFEWAGDHISYFVDGQKVRTVTGSPTDLPGRPGRIIANLWPALGLDDWSGTFAYPGAPVTAQYDWLKYSPPDKTTVYKPPAPETPAQTSAWVKNVTSEKTGKLGADGAKLIRATVEFFQPIPAGYIKAKLEICTGKCYVQGGPFDIKPGDTAVTVEGFLHHPLRQSSGEYALLKIHNPATKHTIEIKFDLPIPGYE
jgi:beta-glucanase (GH16 family)